MADTTIQAAQQQPLGVLTAQHGAEPTELQHSLSDYFTQLHGTFEETELGPILEPRRILAPLGYHSIKCVSTGMFALLSNRVFRQKFGLPQVPTEVSAHVVLYQVIRYRVPIYFVTEDFVRAVAATDLPHDFALEDLNWPMPGMVVGFPARFMQEYLNRDICYVYAANCDEGDYSAPALPGCPTINVPKAKVSWQFYSWQGGNLESFVSSYFRADRVDETIQNYSYTDYTGIKDGTGIATDKDITDQLSALMLKLLVILNTRPHLVELGRCVRPKKLKHGRVKHSELWSANMIGRSYRPMRDGQAGGTHASPKVHWRRGFVRSQPHGPQWSLRKPMWIEPVLVGLHTAD